MEILAILLLMAIVGEFGGFLKGMGWVIVLVIGIGLAITGISEMYWEDRLILFGVLGAAILIVGGYYLRKYRREQWEITRYGDVLTEKERDEIARDGERTWLQDRIRMGWFKVYTDYDKQRIREVGQRQWRIEENEKAIRMGKAEWIKDQNRQLDEVLEHRGRKERIVFYIDESDYWVFWIYDEKEYRRRKANESD